MKSDMNVVQFCDKEKDGISNKIQTYLNGDNKWKEAILEKDIIDIKYTGNSALLMHRNPTPKITS